jgi:hypothetical protein
MRNNSPGHAKGYQFGRIAIVAGTCSLALGAAALGYWYGTGPSSTANGAKPSLAYQTQLAAFQEALNALAEQVASTNDRLSAELDSSDTVDTLSQIQARIDAIVAQLAMPDDEASERAHRYVGSPAGHRVTTARHAFIAKPSDAHSKLHV